MGTLKEQIPRQDLPDEGSALPSAGTKPEGGTAAAGPSPHSMATKRSGQSQSKGPVADAKKPESRLLEFRDVVRDKVDHPTVAPEDLLLVLRTHPIVRELQLRDEDIERVIQLEKNRKSGRVREIGRGMKLDTRPIPWLWEGMFGADASNLVFGDPKTGKTRFVLGFLGAYLNGATIYLGQKLPKQRNELLIVGPDMTEGSWSSFLTDFHLGTADGEMHEKIRAVIAQGHDFQLDEQGIEQIRKHAEESPGLIVLIDSLTTVMNGLGLDENRPNYVDPINTLKDQIAPYKATTLIIHHSKKESGVGSMAADARGSSALTGAVDQLVKLRQFSTGSYTQTSSEIQVCTSGRFSGIQNLVVDWDADSQCWITKGTTQDRVNEAKALEVGDKLSENQQEVIRTVVKVWNDQQRGVSAGEIKLLSDHFTDHPQEALYGFIKPLVDKKGFLKVSGVSSGSKAKGTKLYRPTETAIAWVIKSLA